MLQCLSDKAFLTAVQGCFKPNEICIIKPGPSLLLSPSLHVHPFMFKAEECSALSSCRNSFSYEWMVNTSPLFSLGGVHDAFCN